MPRYGSFPWVLVFAILSFAPSAWAGEQKVALAIGGKFCVAYLSDLETALKQVPGVKSVDFKSKKNHAVVTASDSVKPKELVKAMKSVKGDGWFCDGEVAK